MQASEQRQKHDIDASFKTEIKHDVDASFRTETKHDVDASFDEKWDDCIKMT